MLRPDPPDGWDEYDILDDESCGCAAFDDPTVTCSCDPSTFTHTSGFTSTVNRTRNGETDGRHPNEG